jgi:hypothetical protein
LDGRAGLANVKVIRVSLFFYADVHRIFVLACKVLSTDFFERIHPEYLVKSQKFITFAGPLKAGADMDLTARQSGK